MTATTDFYIWFYNGLNGLGGWFLFFLVAITAVVWLLYDSSRRRLPVFGWKIAIVLLAALLVPAILFRFSNPDTKVSLSPFTEVIFYLGLLGGLMPVVLAIGYFFTFRDLIGCQNGHTYEEVLGQCPDCGQALEARARVESAVPVQQPLSPVVQPQVPVAPHVSSKPKVSAWLISESGRTYQLCQGETTIGRSSANDIKVDSDTTVSRQHVKIIEQNGHFRIIDLGSSVGTRLNDRRLREPVTLEADDVIALGEKTSFRFKC
jgi:hypothetical protein